MEQAKNEKIRTGILIEELTVPLWVYSMIEKINNSPHSEIVLIVKKKKSISRNRSVMYRMLKNHRHIMYNAYRRIEDKFFRPAHFAFMQKDLSPLISAVPVIEVEPIMGKYSDIIEQADIENIKKYNVDVLIRIGFRILRGNILKAANYGIWSYHHGDNRINRGGPACVWESLEGWKEMGCVLQILTEDLDAGLVLYRSWSGKKGFLINEGINSVYWKAASFIPRKLKDLYILGGEAFKASIQQQNEEVSFYYNRHFKTPKNSEFISRILVKLLKRLQYKLWRLFYFEQWILLYCFHKENNMATTIHKYKRIVPPKDRFWADPCIVYSDNRYYIFVEEMIYKQSHGKAHIAMIEMDALGNCKPSEIVLKQECHLSYPFVFNYQGQFFMIPETSEKHTIELYRCTAFPDKWEFVMVLKNNVKAVDTTIFEKDNKFWMFTNIQENQGASQNDELFVFYADDLLTTQWHPHPGNPVVSDVKSARPAGALFVYNKKLYRPSQNSSLRYGYAISINEVVEINEKQYIEKPVSSILPHWSRDVIATHTLTNQMNLTVIDAMIKRRK